MTPLKSKSQKNKFRRVATAIFITTLMMAIHQNSANAAVSINEDLRPSYAPQTYEELYEENTLNPDQNFSDRSVTYVIADFAVVLLQIAGVLAIFFIVQNGFNYVKAFGRDEEIQKAKKGLLWSILGLLVVLMSYAIVQNVLKITLSVDPAMTSTQTTTPDTGTSNP